MCMGIEGKAYDFTKDYKKLPIKKRLGLIRTAKNLLKQQKKDLKTIADASCMQSPQAESAG